MDERTVRAVAAASRSDLPEVAHDARAEDVAGSMSRPPVFLVGPARSGTSLLYKVLCLHPGASYISNWVARYPGRWWMASFNEIPRRLPSRTRQVWFGGGSNAYVYGRTRSLLERVYPMPVEGEPVYRACGVGEEGSPVTGEGNDALRRAVSSIQRSSRGVFFVNKRVANNRRIPLLARTFPSARFLWIARDGRAVAYSLSRVDWWEDSHVWWYGGTPQRWRQEGGDPWELCARNWVEELAAIEEGIGVVPEDRVLRLSYESFVHDPMSTLGAISDFLDLPRSEVWERAARALRYPDRNEAWRERLDPRAVETITAIQEAKLTEYGYAA